MLMDEYTFGNKYFYVINSLKNKKNSKEIAFASSEKKSKSHSSIKTSC